VEVVLISANASLEEGNNVALACVGYGQPQVEISWSTGGETLLNSSSVAIYEREFDHDGILFKESILELCSVTVEDSGDYTCIISNTLVSANSTTKVTVYCESMHHSELNIQLPQFHW